MYKCLFKCLVNQLRARNHCGNDLRERETNPEMFVGFWLGKSYPQLLPEVAHNALLEGILWRSKIYRVSR